jgi:hypothetical protein
MSGGIIMWSPQAIAALVAAVTALVAAVTALVRLEQTRGKVASLAPPDPGAPARPPAP